LRKQSGQGDGVTPRVTPGVQRSAVQTAISDLVRPEILEPSRPTSVDNKCEANDLQYGRALLKTGTRLVNDPQVTRHCR
jgi:hypothetical protein